MVGWLVGWLVTRVNCIATQYDGLGTDFARKLQWPGTWVKVTLCWVKVGSSMLPFRFFAHTGKLLERMGAILVAFIIGLVVEMCQSIKIMVTFKRHWNARVV